MKHGPKDERNKRLITSFRKIIIRKINKNPAGCCHIGNDIHTYWMKKYENNPELF